MARDENRRKTRTPARTLSLRLVELQTRWLSSAPFWDASLNRVVYSGYDSKIVVPDAEALSKAQRRLYAIARERKAILQTMPNFDEWRASRLSQLEQAKLFSTLRIDSLVALQEGIRQQNQSALNQTALLLIAEGLCLGQLPFSPAAEILKMESPPIAAIHNAFRSQSIPDSARAFIALVLGILWAQCDRKTRLALEQSIKEANHYYSRCFEWGQRHGFPQMPALVLELLKHPVHTADQALTLLDDLRFLQLPEAMLVKLVRKHNPEAAIRILEAATSLKSVAESVMCYRQIAINATPAKNRKDQAQRLAETLRAERQQLLQLWCELVQCLLLEASPLVITQFRDICITLVERIEPLPELAAHLRNIIYPPCLPAYTVLHEAYLGLVLEYREKLFIKSEQDASQFAKGTAGDYKWLQHVIRKDIVPLARLLKLTENVTLVQRAFEAHLHTVFADATASSWQCEFTMSAIREGYLDHASVREFINFLCRFRSQGEASASINRLLNLLPETNVELRNYRFLALLRAVDTDESEQTWQAALAILPLLYRWKETHNENVIWNFFVDQGLHLSKHFDNQQLIIVLEWLLQPQWCDKYFWQFGLREALQFSARLCDGDTSLFRNLVPIVAKQINQKNESRMIEGLNALDTAPELRQVFVEWLRSGHSGCLDLLSNIAIVFTLFSDISPLTRILPGSSSGPEESTSCIELQRRHWRTALQIAPMLRPLILRYIKSATLSGKDIHGLPKAVLKLIDVDRTNKEIARINNLIENLEPGVKRDRLLIRKENLLKRTALVNETDSEGLNTQLARKLERSIYRACVAAEIEHMSRMCLELCLIKLTPYKFTADETTARQLLSNSEFSASLLNALCILEEQIESARFPECCGGPKFIVTARLLRGYLRAWCSGDLEWPRRQPGNARFLKRLEAQSISSHRWLSTYPRVYKVNQEGSPCCRVKLYLENDVLKVLQMGNLFGTCLSPGRGNSSTAIVNAIDLNKRVIYAVDDRGKIVGRKLIALDKNLKLVGYPVYDHFGTSQFTCTLRQIFTQYCRDFAAYAGIELADQAAEVEILCGGRWNPDNAVPWSGHDRSADFYASNTRRNF